MSSTAAFSENLDEFLGFIEKYGRPPLINDDKRLYNFGTNTVARVRNNTLASANLELLYERIPVLRNIKGYGDLSKYYRELRNTGKLKTKEIKM